jgi:glucose/arabinose dehydrogenase
MACLRGEKVYRITLDGAGGVAGTPQPLFAGQFGRIRQVVVEPAGTLLMLTSNRDGRGTVRPGDDKIIRFDG